MRHPRHTRAAEQQRIHRPGESRQGAHRDQRVHRRRAMLEVRPRGPMERPRRPRHHRRGQRQRNPLPIGELQRRNHRQHDHRHRQHGSTDQAIPQRPRRIIVAVRRGRRFPRRLRLRQSRRVTGGLHLSHELVRLHAIGVDDLGLFRGVVHRGGDPVELVELAFDPVRARRARHATNRQLDLPARGRLWVFHLGCHCATPSRPDQPWPPWPSSVADVGAEPVTRPAMSARRANSAVRTFPSCWKSKNSR